MIEIDFMNHTYNCPFCGYSQAFSVGGNVCKVDQVGWWVIYGRGQASIPIPCISRWCKCKCNHI